MSRLVIARVTIAFVALGLIVLPGEAWPQPESSFEQNGFDPQLVYISEPQGVSASEAELRLSPSGGETPGVHVITTPLSFRASFVATIEQRAPSAAPLHVRFWNPRNGSSLTLAFEDDGYVYGLIEDGPGRIGRRAPMVPYEIAAPYNVEVEWERGVRAALAVSGGGRDEAFEVGPAEAPALFDAYRPTLSIGASANGGSSAASLTEYRLALSPDRFTTLPASSPVIPLVVTALALVGAMLMLAAITPTAVARQVGEATVRSAGSLGRWIREHPTAAAGSGSFVALYAAANFLLFTLGSHPFDMGSEATWSYIAADYGITDLYYVSQTATLADVWNGVPYHEAVFPYNTGMAYYFWLIGEAHLLLFGDASPDSTSLHVTIKAFNLAFLFADAVLIYAIVRHLRPDSRYLGWAVPALVLLNPAVMFDTAVWGETESVVLFPLLASLLAALKDRPGIAWPFLALAFLTKQTILLPVVVIGLGYLVRFDLRRTLEGFSAAMLAVLAVILPFALNGYPPSIAIDPTLAAIWVHGGTGAEMAFQVVSYDSFNIWTLITFAADDATGLARFQVPDYTNEVGSLSYHDLGLIALVASLAFLGVLAYVRRRSLLGGAGWVFPGIALVFALELVLPTQTLSRYWVFAVVFATIGLAGPSRLLSALALVTLTLTSFVGQYGSMAVVLDSFPQHGEHLAPQSNPLSRVMADLFVSNGFITAAVVLNVLGTLALGAAFARGARLTVEMTPTGQAAERGPIAATVGLAARGEV